MKNLRESGFTIIELMLSIFVMAILAFIAVPSMQGMVERGRVDTAVNEIFGALVAARSEAISRNQAVVLCTSNTGSSCVSGGWELGWIAYADVDSDSSLDAGEPVLAVYNPLNGVTLRKDGTNVYRLGFLPDGSIAEITNFNICRPSAVLADGHTIAISVTGRPRSSSGALVCP